MPTRMEDLQLRLQTGRESLDTELKPWFSPTTDFGRSIIAKTCMALRNAGGGLLVIGMNNDGTADRRRHIADVHAAFHHDVVQGIVSKFASEPFEITVHFVPHESAERVVIEVPRDIRTPVVCRNNLPRLKTPKGDLPGSLLHENAVYVRTLNTNGTPSSAPATIADWPRLIEICFNNREGDIGAFVRRQLSGLDLTSASSAILEALNAAKGLTQGDAATSFLDASYERFLAYREKSSTAPRDVGTREVAAVIEGAFPRPELDREYMWRLGGQIPRLSGWPPFAALLNLDSGLGTTAFDDESCESFENVAQHFKSLDFSRIESAGRFYYLEALRDDLARQIKPREHLDFVIETARITEIIATILLFAKHFCGNDSDNQVHFAIRWRSLAGRALSSWSDPARGFVDLQPSIKDELVQEVVLPVAIAVDAIGLHIETIVKPLFRLFGGRTFESGVIQQIVSGRLQRRL
jgi:hypothetical protein